MNKELIINSTSSEVEIALLEENIKKTEEILIQPEKFKDKVTGAQLYNEYEHLRNRLNVEMKNWEDLHGLLEKMEDGG